MTAQRNVTTVFVIANSIVLRAGLKAVVQSDKRFAVIGSAAKIAELPSLEPDVILLSLERQDKLTQFLQSIEEMNESGGFPPLVVLAEPDLPDEFILRALQMDVRGILTHEAASEEIIAALIAAANELIILAPEITKSILQNSATNEQILTANQRSELSTEFTETLTLRELQVLEFLAEGTSNKLIAYRLDISEHTVKFHVSSIFAKLNVTTRTEAVTQALRRGLILL